METESNGIGAVLFVLALFGAYYGSVKLGFWKGFGWPTPKSDDK